MIIYLGIYLGIFILSSIGVWLFIIWSRKKNLLDMPNERSSHVRPTPRGGGIVFFILSLVSFLVYGFLSGNGIVWSYLAGSIIVAGISWLDDLLTVSPIWRFLCHGLAALLVIWDLGALTTFQIPFAGFTDLGLIGHLITFFWIIWLINAYNFMDGIDGIAGIQAVTTGIGWSILGFYSGIEILGFYGGVLTASVLGFLIYNWSPAKVFMGDVGSAFLGFSFAVLPLLGHGKGSFEGDWLWIGIIFVWFFVFDSVLTLLKRLVKGEKIWQAHRQHIYQTLVISGFSHAFVTLFYGILSAFLVICLLIFVQKPHFYIGWVFCLACLESIFLLVFLRTKKHLE